MHPSDCPEFEYSSHHLRDTAITTGLKAALRQLADPAVDFLVDTRPLHAELFKELCPPNCDYFAGHYRGEDFRCLKFYGVVIAGDPRVGCPPEHVLPTMEAFGRQIRSEIESTDALFLTPDALSPTARLVGAVACACRIFVDFLTIHPYANGNGHIARLLLTAALQRYNFRLQGFPVEPRPDPPYVELIWRYRNGQVEPLERYVIQRLK